MQQDNSRSVKKIGRCFYERIRKCSWMFGGKSVPFSRCLEPIGTCCKATVRSLLLSQFESFGNLECLFEIADNIN